MQTHAHGAMEQILSARKSHESTDRAAHRVAAGPTQVGSVVAQKDKLGPTFGGMGGCVEPVRSTSQKYHRDLREYHPTARSDSY